MKNIEVLREQWMWQREARSICLWLLTATGVILAAALHPFLGLMGLAVGFLPFLLVCVIVGLIYGFVGRKVRALGKSLEDEEGEIAEGLAQIGNIQGPAFVILREAELVLAPLVGKRLTVPFGDIESVRETRSLHGKGFLWKRAFHIEAPQRKRIGFAVPPSVADRWRDRLRLLGRRHV